jgi:pimeloyl-ACP methyl ester carboxylesterase
MVGLAFAQEHPPKAPGRLVDLGSRHLHIRCVGTGAPTVVLESGGGGISVDWLLVQQKIANHTRICAYDRAGYAWSDPGPTVDSIEQIADDLGLLLRRAGIRPPYVLVGASLGALFARAYQRRFPEQIAGLVLVDGSHEDGITLMRDDKPFPISQLSRDELPSAYDAYVRAAPKPKAGPANAEPLNRLPDEARQSRDWAFQKVIEEIGLLPNGLLTAESWRQEFTALRLDRLAKPHPLGTLPLVVLERAEGTNDTWHKHQLELARLSSRGKLVRAEKSGHLIHLYRPDLVAEAILEVVAKARLQ